MEQNEPFWLDLNMYLNNKWFFNKMYTKIQIAIINQHIINEFSHFG